MPEQLVKGAQPLRLLTINKQFTEADFNKHQFTWDVKDMANKETVELNDRDTLALKHPTTTIHMPNIGAPRYRNKLASEVLEFIPEAPPGPDTVSTSVRDRSRNSIILLPVEPNSAGIKPTTKPDVARTTRFKPKQEEPSLDLSVDQPEPPSNKPKSLEDRSKSFNLDKAAKDTDRLQDYLFMAQQGPVSVNTSMTNPNVHIKELVSKKLGWHVDTSALVRKDEFKSILKMLMSKYNLEPSEYSTVKHHLLQLTSYFESFVQKLFVDSKSSFFETEFIKAVFSEELNLKRGRDSRSHHDSRRVDDSSHPNSVEYSLIKATIKKNSSSKRRTQNTKASYAASPQVNLSSARSHAGKSITVMRASVVAPSEASLEFKLPPGVKLSMSISHKRSWTVKQTILKLPPTFTVLVVDDVPEQVRNMVEIFDYFPNINTETAHDGDEAVRKVRDKMDQGLMYHLIVTDLTMPYDGYSLAKDVRTEEKSRNTSPRYQIFGITAVTDEKALTAIDERATKAGIDGILSKPITMPDIRKLVEERIGQLGSLQTKLNRN